MIQRKFKTGFREQNHFLNLWSRVVSSQRLFCSQKSWCVVYKINYVPDIKSLKIAHHTHEILTFNIKLHI